MWFTALLCVAILLKLTRHINAWQYQQEEPWQRGGYHLATGPQDAGVNYEVVWGALVEPTSTASPAAPTHVDVQNMNHVQQPSPVMSSTLEQQGRALPLESPWSAVQEYPHLNSQLQIVHLPPEQYLLPSLSAVQEYPNLNSQLQIVNLPPEQYLLPSLSAVQEYPHLDSQQQIVNLPPEQYLLPSLSAVEEYPHLNSQQQIINLPPEQYLLPSVSAVEEYPHLNSQQQIVHLHPDTSAPSYSYMTVPQWKNFKTPYIDTSDADRLGTSVPYDSLTLQKILLKPMNSYRDNFRNIYLQRTALSKLFQKFLQSSGFNKKQNSKEYEQISQDVDPQEEYEQREVKTSHSDDTHKEEKHNHNNLKTDYKKITSHFEELKQKPNVIKLVPPKFKNIAQSLLLKTLRDKLLHQLNYDHSSFRQDPENDYQKAENAYRERDDSIGATWNPIVASKLGSYYSDEGRQQIKYEIQKPSYISNYQEGWSLPRESAYLESLKLNMQPDRNINQLNHPYNYADSIQLDSENAYQKTHNQILYQAPDHGISDTLNMKQSSKLGPYYTEEVRQNNKDEMKRPSYLPNYEDTWSHHREFVYPESLQLNMQHQLNNPYIYADSFQQDSENAYQKPESFHQAPYDSIANIWNINQILKLSLNDIDEIRHKIRDEMKGHSYLSNGQEEWSHPRETAYPDSLQLEMEQQNIIDLLNNKNSYQKDPENVSQNTKSHLSQDDSEGDDEHRYVADSFESDYLIRSKLAAKLSNSQNTPYQQSYKKQPNLEVMFMAWLKDYLKPELNGDGYQENNEYHEKDDGNRHRNTQSTTLDHNNSNEDAISSSTGDNTFHKLPVDGNKYNKDLEEDYENDEQGDEENPLGGIIHTHEVEEESQKKTEDVTRNRPHKAPYVNSDGDILIDVPLKIQPPFSMPPITNVIFGTNKNENDKKKSSSTDSTKQTSKIGEKEAKITIQPREEEEEEEGDEKKREQRKTESIRKVDESTEETSKESASSHQYKNEMLVKEKKKKGSSRSRKAKRTPTHSRDSDINVFRVKEGGAGARNIKKLDRHKRFASFFN